MEDLCIGGKHYEVQLVKRIARDTFLMGETDFVEQTIKVHDSLKADRKREVLLHEIVHCIFEDSGDTVSNNDERLVSTIASGLNQVLSHNPWLVSLFISKGLHDEESLSGRSSWERERDAKDILLSILEKRGKAFDAMREAGR